MSEGATAEWRSRPVRFCAFVLVLGSTSSCALAENYDDPNGPRYAASFAPPLSPADAELEELSVCSFNIEFSERIGEAIDDLRGDENLGACTVVLLQEMDWPGARRIAEALSLDVVYYPGSVHHDKDFGNAVLSRWPIEDDAKLILPHRNPTNGRIRIAVSATLAVPFDRVTAYSVHSDTPWLGPEARLEQAESIADDAAHFAWPVVVGGDFNTSDPGSVERTVELFEKRAFAWATARVPATGDGLFGGVQIDHVFVKGLSVTGAGTVPSDASDHQPLWVDLHSVP